LKREHAFTLIEVLVALAILGIALAASMRTLHLSTDASRDTRERLAATWLLQNRLAEMEARRIFVPVGESNGEVDFAGLKLIWRQKVLDTPNPAFRRVELSAHLPQRPEHALAKLTGFSVQAP
jgi:general secretion pathway protein I